MPVQTSIAEPAFAVAGMVYDGATTADGCISGFASEDLEPGIFVAWANQALKTLKKFTGASGEVLAGVVKFDTTVPQGYAGATVATYVTGAQVTVVRCGRVWMAFDGVTAATVGAQLYTVAAAGANRGKATRVSAGNVLAPVMAYKASLSGLVCAEINLSTGSALAIA